MIRAKRGGKKRDEKRKEREVIRMFKDKGKDLCKTMKKCRIKLDKNKMEKNASPDSEPPPYTLQLPVGNCAISGEYEKITDDQDRPHC